jgi:Flp pilus assembly protein TadD
MWRRLPLFLFALAALATAQRPGQSVRLTDVYVNVSYENGRPVGELYRVQLMGRGGYSIAEGYTNDRGQIVFHQMGPGSYRLKITGPDIEDTSTERGFEVFPNQIAQHEHVSVKRKPDPQDQSSTQPFVSAATLNIPSKARGEFEKGMAKYRKQEFDKAETHLTKAVELYGRYAEAINALGVIAMTAGNVDQGRARFQEAMHADPEHPGAYVNMARLMMQEKQFSDGEPLLLKAVSLNPQDAEALSILSFFQLSLQKHDDAVKTAQRVHSLPHPQYAMVHFVAASALEQSGRGKEAADELRLYIKESPPGPGVERAKAALNTLEAKLR